MSFSIVTQFALLVFQQKWKFVLQREAHSTSSQGLLEHGGIDWHKKEAYSWRKDWEGILNELEQLLAWLACL